jgi:hypothetical protein
MGTMVSGALLPCGVGNDIEPAIVEGLESLQQYVGGMIDAVRTELEDGTVIVGYVNDEGLMLNMETNWFASALFNRQIVGDVVLVSGTSPEGEYDGENYDLPESFFRFLSTKFTEHVAQTYNESMVMTLGINLAHRFGVIDDEEMRNLQQQIDDAVEGGDDAALKAHLLDISDRVTNFVTNYVSERHADDMISGLEELLKTEAEGK